MNNSYLKPVGVVSAEKYGGFAITPRPFGLPRSPFAAGDEAAEHIQESWNTEESVEKDFLWCEMRCGEL